MRDLSFVQDAEAQTLTTWRNPTPHAMVVDIFEGHGRPRKRYTFPPGKEVSVPSEHDRAIHDVRDGVIVGGLAPLLERVVEDGVLHPALDPELAAKKAVLEEAQKAIVATRAAQDVLHSAARVGGVV
jgi:hypothetical protein